MARITTIDLVEIPSAGNDLGIRFTRARPRFQKNQGFHVDATSGEDIPFLLQGVRRDPDAVLKTTKSAVSKIAPQSSAVGVSCYWNVKQHEPPSPIPRSKPTSFRVPSPQRMQSSRRCRNPSGCETSDATAFPRSKEGSSRILQSSAASGRKFSQRARLDASKLLSHMRQKFVGCVFRTFA